MSEAKLKPCPFCGGTNIVIHRDDGIVAQRLEIERYRLCCKDCAAQLYRGTKEEVIEAWNRRVKDNETDRCRRDRINGF